VDDLPRSTLDPSGKNHNLVTLTMEVASEKASDLPPARTIRRPDSWRHFQRWQILITVDDL
jgi:hypothetical protein